MCVFPNSKASTRECPPLTVHLFSYTSTCIFHHCASALKGVTFGNQFLSVCRDFIIIIIQKGSLLSHVYNKCTAFSLCWALPLVYSPPYFPFHYDRCVSLIVMWANTIDLFPRKMPLKALCIKCYSSYSKCHIYLSATFFVLSSLLIFSLSYPIPLW